MNYQSLKSFFSNGLSSVLILIFMFLLQMLQSDSIAQPQSQTNLQLANQFYQQGDFEKALVYYEKNYDFDPFGTYSSYLNCLIALKDYSGAEKLIKKQMKKANGATMYLVDLGNLYEIKGEPALAKEQYNKAIKNTKPDIQQYISLANSFAGKSNYEYAINTYLEGRRNLKGRYMFSFELAEIYDQNSDAEKMIKEYVDVLEYAPQSMANLQSILQNKIALDMKGIISDMLRTELLKRVQKEPGKTQFSEMLYWLLLQEKDFDSALIQAKSLDKLLDENGARLLSLGQMAASNQQYATAEECFQTIMNKGRDNPLYATARINLINASYQRITTQSTYTQTDIDQLDLVYTMALNEMGRSASTSELIRNQANLRAFYLNQTDTAIIMLESLINMPGLSAAYKAQVKLDAGDMLIFKNELWEALLYYGQVDKDFKLEELGREAKYRVARSYYYVGQFEWASAQLNILKAATTQLISNDAMQLALLIQDNSTIDTNTIPLLIYAYADLLSFQNHKKEALVTLDSILTLFPGHSLTDEVLFKKANIYRSQAANDSAIVYYTMVYEQYATDIYADDAIYSLAQLYDFTLNDKAKAKELYEKLLREHGGSLFAADARKRFRSLRGDKLN